MKSLFYSIILFSFVSNYVFLYAGDESLRDFNTSQIKELIDSKKDKDKPNHNNPNYPHLPNPNPHPVPNPQPHPQPQPTPNPIPPNPQPQPIPQPVPEPPKPPVDTTNAYNAGFRDGTNRGMVDGRRDGYSDGIRDGERDGRWRGKSDGERAGREAGYRDGYNVDQSQGTQRGNIDGQNAGIKDGTLAGKRRCYDEGYNSSYNVAYAEGKSAGLTDVSSYNSGYSKGESDAKVLESDKGKKAGYQAGFSQREAEIENSFSEIKSVKSVFVKNLLESGDMKGISIDMAKGGFTTPEEKAAYDKGYREGYQQAYRRAFDNAKREGYNEGYNRTYTQSYTSQYSISYREGFNDGKEKGYQDAYNRAYNSAYDFYYNEYKRKDYAEDRARGMSDGRDKGYKDGFAFGSQEQYRKGYKAGYDKTAAEIYPQAYEEGRQAGIVAADKYYADNAVLKAYNVSFKDESGDGKFEANEGVILTAEIRNLGFKNSNEISLKVKNARGEILFNSNLTYKAIESRKSAHIEYNIGKIYDVASPGSDTLYVSFLEKEKVFSDYEQVYLRVNSNKVGIAKEDDTKVLKKATWFFPGEVGKIDKGDKVLIIGDKDDYYKVKKSDFSNAGWTEGYIKKGKLELQ